MSWSEFISLLSGLMPDTPLGQIVTIRSEKDREVIKRFTPDQKRIRNEWVLKNARKNVISDAQYDKEMARLSNALRKAFSPKTRR